MSGATRFTIAALISLIAVAAFVAFFLMQPDEIELEQQRRDRGAESALVDSSGGDADPSDAIGSSDANALDTESASEDETDGIPDAPPARLVRGRWLLTGRVVRRIERGGVESLVPATGASVILKPHPNRTDPDDAPSSQRSRCDDEGRFALVAIPGRIWLRVEIDASAAAYRTLSFKLAEPEWKGQKDLGDIVIEAARDVRLKIIGPGGELVDGAEVLVGRKKTERSLAMEEAGVKESRRLARGLGEGLYALDRAAPGILRVQVRAPGFARFREYVEVPEGEPLTIQLQEGLSIVGRVESLDGEPLSGVGLEVDGPNIGSPLPTQTTAEDGRFAFTTLSSGEYDIDVTAPGHVSTTHKDITAGVEEVVFRLARESIFSGSVVEDDGGRPIEGAEIELKSAAGDRFKEMSGADGSFRIGGLPGELYRITIEHEDFQSFREHDLEIPAEGEVGAREFRLQPGLTAIGIVVDGETPVPGALVSIASRNSKLRISKKVESDANGEFRLLGLVEGEYNISAKADGFLAGKAKDVTISAASENEFTLELERGAEIHGRVTDSAGDPVAAATLEVRQLPKMPKVDPAVSQDPSGATRLMRSSFSRASSTGGRIASALSALDGSYVLDGIPEGEGYIVVARHRDFTVEISEAIDLESRERIEGVDLSLTRGGLIRGRVIDSEGLGVPGARVRASIKPQSQPSVKVAELGPEGIAQAIRASLSSSSSATYADNDGDFVLRRLTAGSYTVSASADGLVSGSVDDIAVQVDEVTEDVEIVLDVGEIIAGIVIDSSGAPVVGARVSASGVSSSRATTDLEGRFELLGLKPGEHNVSVQKTGFVPASVKVDAPSAELAMTLEVEARIVGVVMIATTGEPLDGARVSLRPASTQAPQAPGVPGASPPQPQGTRKSTSSRSDGSFKLDGVVAGEYRLDISHQDYAPVRLELGAIAAGEERSVDVELRGGGWLRGVVTGAGVPLADARISVYSNTSSSPGGVRTSKSARSGPDGSFEIRGLPGAEYRLGVNPPNGAIFIPHNSSLVIVDDQENVADIELDEAIRLTGVVTANGVPVAGARISFSPTQGGRGASARSDQSGSYSAILASPGAYRYDVRTNSGGNARGDVVVEVKSGAARADIELPAGRISGLVVEAESGAPVPRAQITLMQSSTSLRSVRTVFSGMSSSARTDDSGRFVIDFVSPGSYSIHVYAQGFAPGRIESVEYDGRRSIDDVRIELSLGGSAIIEVRDPSGNPVGGVIGIVRDESGNIAQLGSSKPSDGAGVLRIDGLPAGRYTISLMQRDFASTSVELVVTGNGEVRASAELDPGGSLEVTVVDARGVAVEGAIVTLAASGGVSLEDTGIFTFGPGGARTDANGVALFPHLAPGRLEVSAMRGQQSARSERVSLRRGSTQKVSLTIR